MGQQASLTCCPHVAQIPLTHRVPGAVQSEAVAPTYGLQQGWPAPPQVPHAAPAPQVPGSGAQLPPLAWHRPDTQQPLPAQTLPPQQG
jgi:hypothetical protein